ncbi:uncharacterized protein LOC143956897 [Lithobates pipiens]
MMTFYIWVLVVGVIGLSDGESVMCLKGKDKNISVTCGDDHQRPTEGYEKEIHLWCNITEIICPVRLKNVRNDTKSQEVKCNAQKSRKEKVKTYYCQIEKPLYISALLSALPDEPGSPGWKNKMAKIFEGVPGVQEWLNKSKTYWERFRRPQDWLKDAFWKKLPDFQDWLSRIKQFFPDNKTRNPNNGDKKDENNRSEIPQIVLPCLAVVLILVICAFLLWRKNRKLQRNLKIGGASDQAGKKMGSTGDIDLKSTEFPPVPHRHSHIYQEIPATQEDPAEVLQNPLYSPSGPPSLEQQSGPQVEHPAEGQYSLLQPPTQLLLPDQQ